MTLASSWNTVFAPTPEMVERHRGWVEEMVAAVWQMWCESGDVAREPDRARRMIEDVRGEYAVSRRERWMHPMRSIAVRVSPEPEDDSVPTGGERLDYFDAMRTFAGLSTLERRHWVGLSMGVSPDSIRKYEDHPERRTRRHYVEERTALYRHFDADGRLLYVGISNDPDVRFKLHAYTAGWYPYAARRTDEWYERRADALAAESAAIAGERPLFNRRDSIADPDVARRYLETCAPLPR